MYIKNVEGVYLVSENGFGYVRPFLPCNKENEFDNNDNWEVIEKFAEYIGGREDVWYATNIEIYDYVKAYERLETSIDKRIIHNPSSIDVWFFEQNKTYCGVKASSIELVTMLLNSEHGISKVKTSLFICFSVTSLKKLRVFKK